MHQFVQCLLLLLNARPPFLLVDELRHLFLIKYVLFYNAKIRVEQKSVPQQQVICLINNLLVRTLYQHHRCNIFVYFYFVLAETHYFNVNEPSAHLRFFSFSRTETPQDGSKSHCGRFHAKPMGIGFRGKHESNSGIHHRGSRNGSCISYRT